LYAEGYSIYELVCTHFITSFRKIFAIDIALGWTTMHKSIILCSSGFSLGSVLMLQVPCPSGFDCWSICLCCS